MLFIDCHDNGEKKLNHHVMDLYKPAHHVLPFHSQSLAGFGD
jgi:hypothetical protein